MPESHQEQHLLHHTHGNPGDEDLSKEDLHRLHVESIAKMAEYFDAYRIDHILGFFRIWEIPMHAVHGLLGQFVPALPMTREEIESYGLPPSAMSS